MQSSRSSTRRSSQSNRGFIMAGRLSLYAKMETCESCIQEDVTITFGEATPAMLKRWKAMDAVTTLEQKNADKGHWMLRSTDGGVNWSKKQKVAMGYPSHLLRLKDGTLLMTYGWRKEPYGIRGRSSTDHGRSWSDEFILSDDAANWDVGYPSSVELQDGTLLTVWYEAPEDSHKAALRQSRWRLKR